MGATRQSGFNQEVAKALVESGAIDLAKMTDSTSKVRWGEHLGSRAATPARARPPAGRGRCRRRPGGGRRRRGRGARPARAGQGARRDGPALPRRRTAARRRPVRSPASEGLGAAQARLGDALTRALDPHRAALAVAADPRVPRPEAFPFALLGDLDTGHRAVARRLLDLVDAEPRRRARRLRPPRARVAARAWPRAAPPPTCPRGSVLERGADLLHGELTDAYGAHPRRAARHRLRPAPAPHLRPATLGRRRRGGAARGRARRRNLDVAAELLWTWPMLGLPLSPGARYALAELDRAEATHGFLPGPEHDPAVAAGLAPADRSTYVIQTSYHTAVVGGDPRRGPAARRARRHPAAVPADRRDRMPTRCPSSVLADGPWADGPAHAVPGRAGGLHRAGARRRAAHRRRPARPGAGAPRRRLGGRHGWAHLPSVARALPCCTRAARRAGRARAQPTSPAERPDRRRPLSRRADRSAQLEVAVVDPAQPGDREVVEVALHHPPRAGAAPGAAAGAPPAARSPT